MSSSWRILGHIIGIIAGILLIVSIFGTIVEYSYGILWITIAKIEIQGTGLGRYFISGYYEHSPGEIGTFFVPIVIVFMIILLILGVLVLALNMKLLFFESYSERKNQKVKLLSAIQILFACIAIIDLGLFFAFHPYFEVEGLEDIHTVNDLIYYVERKIEAPLTMRMGSGAVCVIIAIVLLILSSIFFIIFLKLFEEKKAVIKV